jgi:hypothetical protein
VTGVDTITAEHVDEVLGVDVGGERPTLVALGPSSSSRAATDQRSAPTCTSAPPAAIRFLYQFGVAALPAPDPMTTRSSPRGTYIDMTGRRSPPDRPTTSSRNSGRPTNVLPFRPPLDR